MKHDFAKPSNKWSSMSAELHASVMKTRTTIANIPDDIEIEEECRLVDAASAKACQIARKIVARPATNTRQRRVKGLAAAWLDGTYPQ